MFTIKRLTFAAIASIFVATSLPHLAAADAPVTAPAPASDGTAKTEFKVVFDQITAKLKSGQNTEADLATEIAAIDSILAKHAAEKTEQVALVALMKARLYLEVFENTEKGIALLKQLKIDFPKSEIAKNIDQIVDGLERQAAAASRLAVGKQFPPFSEKDLNDKPLALADFKGKIVLVDFWATWCGPCVQELPNVLAAYEKFHGKGFEIIGISLDQSKEALTGFIKERGMTWVQYFDGLGWKNKLGEQYGIQAIPATFLLDGEGKIIARNLRGPALEKQLAALLP